MRLPKKKNILPHSQKEITGNKKNSTARKHQPSSSYICQNVVGTFTDAWSNDIILNGDEEKDLFSIPAPRSHFE